MAKKNSTTNCVYTWIEKGVRNYTWRGPNSWKGVAVISIAAREVGVEDEHPLLMVGISEFEESDEGRDFFFQCDLRCAEYPDVSNWPEGESYCVTTERGLTYYGAVRNADFRDNILRVTFTDDAAEALQLEDNEVSFTFDSQSEHVAQVLPQLRMVLTCGRPEYRARLTGF